MLFWSVDIILWSKYHLDLSQIMNDRPAAINGIWLGMILVAILVAAFNGKMDEITRASFESAKSSVKLAIELIGPMALWLGLIKVAEDGGLLKIMARWVRPVMIRLFPDVPPDHPAMSAMIMNMSANALGLGNAATPIGIKAMKELEKLSIEKGVATNAMCLFLAINTSNVTLLPLGVIAVRAAAGARDPAGILLPTILATFLSTIVAILASKFFEKKSPSPELLIEGNRNKKIDTKKPQEEGEDNWLPGPMEKSMILLFLIGFLSILFYKSWIHIMGNGISFSDISSLSSWIIPILMAGLLIFGYLRGVKVYESLTVGAKEGFQTAVKIIPYLVAIFVAIGMLRASGAMDLFIKIFTPIVKPIGMPPEALAMAFMRPLSGSGAFGIMSEIVNNSPDSFLSYVVSVMQGSTETTFYVLAVYFGSIGITKTRHALPSALLADITGLFGAVWFSRLFY